MDNKIGEKTVHTTTKTGDNNLHTGKTPLDIWLKAYNAEIQKKV